MIHLITSFYVISKKDDISLKRNKEILDCLKKNMENPIIKKIHLFVDDINALNIAIETNINNKLYIIDIGKQPLYSDLFEYTIDNLKNEICMISNSDIYLYHCDLNCLNRIENNIFALSRYEHDFTCPIIDNRWGSYDSFIFRSPLKKDFLKNINHPQNVAGSDDSIVNNLVDNGYILYNPCFQIKIVHLHESGLRTYNEIKIAHGKYFIEQKMY
jgi:hypothetical protein